MISVEEAQARVCGGLSVLPHETVSLMDAAGRVLAEPIVARRSQPPAAVSAMDGYAVRAADLASVPVTLTMIGAVPAGGMFEGVVRQGECTRIFTGAPLPDGADTVVIQEDTDANGNQITMKEAEPLGRHIRKAGLDFGEGDTRLGAGGGFLDPHFWHAGLDGLGHAAHANGFTADLHLNRDRLSHEIGGTDRRRRRVCRRGTIFDVRRQNRNRWHEFVQLNSLANDARGHE